MLQFSSLAMTVCRLCFVLAVMDFMFRVQKDRLKGVGSFEDDMYTGMPKGSSKFLTGAGNRDEDIFRYF